MLASLLIGLPAGARTLTPLAIVSDAARRGALPKAGGAPTWLGSPVIELSLAVLAAGELYGDKLPSTPDRTTPIGLFARALSAGLCGAALVPRRRSLEGAVLAASTAVASAYVTFELRRSASRRLGQMRSGLIEDGLTLALSWLAVRAARA